MQVAIVAFGLFSGGATGRSSIGSLTEGADMSLSQVTFWLKIILSERMKNDLFYPERHDRGDVLPSPHRRGRWEAELRSKVFNSLSSFLFDPFVFLFQPIHFYLLYQTIPSIPSIHLSNFSIHPLRAACESPISASNYLQAAKMWYKMHKIIKASHKTSKFIWTSIEVLTTILTSWLILLF